jgi:type IV pilus assembly protein PilY1
MRKPPLLLLTSAALGLVLTGARLGRAQDGVIQPLPNVLLLVDTSGSMEYKSGAQEYPTCDPTGTVASEKSRWIDLVEVLTGQIADYRCQSIDRRSTNFRTEYSLSTNIPYDVITDTPYHRPMSGSCAPGPGVLPTTNAYEYPAGAIRYHDYADLALDCTFDQAQDGLLDVFLGQIRFGLMTFDTHPDPGTGIQSGTAPNYATGITGTWSYFLGTPATGNPTGCSTEDDMEVGARNAAAPPWEGRMVAFGDPSQPPDVRNAWIQEILLAARPYGATPINGMLSDARDFLWNDTSTDPLNPAQPFGPYSDPFASGGCRTNAIILLSDGEPNLDLRPFCEAAGTPAGKCPYAETPEEIVFDLANASDPNRRVETFVIGFSLPSIEVEPGVEIDCKDLTDADLTDTAGKCAEYPGNRELQACCTLNRIAVNGTSDTHDPEDEDFEPRRAFFPTNPDELRAAVSDVLSSLNGEASTRTMPVFASGTAAASNTTNAASYRFFSSFVPQQFTLWQGKLDRERYQCETDEDTGELAAKPQEIDPAKGDDFIQNVNDSPTTRQFWTVQPSALADRIHSARSIRMVNATMTDGVGRYEGTATPFLTGSGLYPQVSPSSMGITTCDTGDVVSCRDKYLKWTLGLDNGTPFHRCPPADENRPCNVVGDIFHSTPALVGPPSARLRDESFARYAAETATRKLVLYTSTNDGFLHAFDVEVDRQTNNELWAFIPPATLQSLQSQYPGAHQLLLDGPPVIREVVATEINGEIRMERTGDSFRAGDTTWRTVLVQAFGSPRGGYFALDITDPIPSADGGPKFLWQLTTTGSGDPLFGPRGAIPTITTLYLDTTSLDGATTGPREVAVAILPGGSGNPPTGDSTARAAEPEGVDSDFEPRGSINAYSDTEIAARSLTIVRLDTGEIIRTFRQSTTQAPAGVSTSRIVTAPIDSPITGTAAVYPAGIGAISDRAYVGDADGVLWRVDLSSPDPSDWTMRMFFDAYSGGDFNDGQPIMTEPVLSVDVDGNLTVAFSTGDQEVFTAPADMKNYVFSLSEKYNADAERTESNANWYVEFEGGERVAGPMSLFVGSLFFSSFQPDSGGGSVCATGESRIWGMDYVIPENENDLSAGGKWALPSSDDPADVDLVQFIDNTDALVGENATIFGVGVAQVPTCAEETQVLDEFFGGYAYHTTATSVTPGKFQLVIQLGGGTDAEGNTRPTYRTRDLPTPYAPARIDGWATIIE